MEIPDLTKNDFEEKTGCQNGILFFHKQLCPFCKTLEAVLEKFAQANPKVPLFRVEFEEQNALSDRFGVERAPTLFILKDGRMAAKKVGLVNPRELKALYEQAQAD